MIVWKHEYEGFESLIDIEQDIYYALNPKYNPKASGIPPEFQGTVKVTIEYIPEEME